jgi:galactofuranose transport system permease protein
MKRLVWPLTGLGAILLFNLFFSPGFFTVEVRDGRLYGSLIDIVNRGTPVMLLALGMTLVIATAGVDLSVGAIMAIAGAIAAGILVRPDGTFFETLALPQSFGFMLFLSLGVAILAGAFNGVLIGRFGVQPIVATLILMVAGRGAAQLLTNAQKVTFNDQRLANLGSGALLGIPMPVIIFLVIFALLAFLIRKSALGLFIEAVGSSARAARLCGINADGIKVFVYACSGLMAGIAGLIAAGDLKGADASNVGLYLELDAILAVAIGGTALTGGRFSLTGSVIGALVMQALTTTILTKGVSPELTQVVKALIIVALCIAQSPRLARRKVAAA